MGFEKKQAERLWLILTGNHPGARSYDADQIAEELARFGEAAADIVLRDVRAAVEFANGDFEDDDDQHRDSLIAELEDGGDGADEYGYSELSWREPWLGEDRLGGMANVFRIRMMLKEIGGLAAWRAISLLSLVEGPLDDVNPKSISELAAVLTGGDTEAACTAAYALGRIGPDAVEPLMALLSPAARVSDEWIKLGNTFQTIRAAAARALGRIGDRRALDALVAAIGTDDGWTSEAAIRAVIALGGDARAVVPILKASVPDSTVQFWNYDGRIDAVQQMGPYGLEALVAATAHPDSETRSLALRALTEAVGAVSADDDDNDDERLGRLERAAACSAASLNDPCVCVRVSAIKLVHRLGIPDLATHLVPLLGDTSEDEFRWSYGGSSSTVGQAAADALPDDDATLETLRRALADGRLDATRAWGSFVDDTEQIRGTVRHGDVLAPYVLEAAMRGDEKAVHALGWVATMRALGGLGQGYLVAAQAVLDAADEQQIQLFERLMEEARPENERLRAEAERLRAEAESLRAERLAPVFQEIRERFRANGDFNTVRLRLLRSEELLDPGQLSFIEWSMADPRTVPNPWMLKALQDGKDAYDKWREEADFYDPPPPPCAVRPDAPVPPSARKLIEARLDDEAPWFLAPEDWRRLTREARVAWLDGMAPQKWAAAFAPKAADRTAGVSPVETSRDVGRLRVRRLYRVGDEFRGWNRRVMKVVGRKPETDAWFALVFDVALHEGAFRTGKSVIRHTVSWYDKANLAALIPVEIGTFESLVRRREEEQATEKKIAVLKTRHGADPRPVALPANPTVQQFAAAVGVSAAEVQKDLRERQGRLLGPRDRIAPDVLAVLCDDHNVIPNTEDEAR